MMPKILALDLGTETGVAWNYPPFPGASTLVLATRQEVAMWGRMRLDRRKDPRPARLFEFLTSKGREVDIVVFEDVGFQTYTKQTQLWASLRTAVWLAYRDIKTLLECVPVTTLKKFATGSGLADKAAMKRALFTQYPQTRPDLDDNAIDAMWVLKWAEHNLGRFRI